MSQHTCSHKNSLNLLGEQYLNESHWPMRRIRLRECNNVKPACHKIYQGRYYLLIFSFSKYLLSAAILSM